MREFWEVVGITAVVGVIVCGCAYLFVYALNAADEEDKKESNAACSQIAKTSNVKEWKVDSSYNCLLVKDGKLITVKDW